MQLLVPKQNDSIHLTLFWTNRSDSLEGYYSNNIEFNDTEILIGLDFDQKTIDLFTMAVVKDFLENIERFDKQNKKYIEQDYGDNTGATIKEYLEHHLAEIDTKDLSAIIDIHGEIAEQEKQLLDQFKLVRLRLKPHDEQSFAQFDYTIGVELTQYLVVLNLDKEGKLDFITTES